MQTLDIVAYQKDMAWEEYLVPGSLDEALEMLERYRGAARVIAGGTDIVPATRKGVAGAKALVDEVMKMMLSLRDEGMGDADHSALVRFYEKNAGIELHR